jgi:ubiquinone/menaquinone biosynthesis C-methylase UbiE
VARGHRWFAAVYDRVMAASDGRLRAAREFVAGGAAGRVLEVGAGTGLNFSYYDWSAVASLDAAEPDPFMLRRADARWRALPEEARARVRLHEAPAEALPFSDATFDTVVVSLVLCTVGDVERSLAEVRRVVKAGGMVRLLEHVRPAGLLGGVTDVVQPVWGWMAAGCHANRRTEAAIRDAGFRLEVTQRIRIGVAPGFYGLALPAEAAIATP